jgi:hypothetical protein
MGAFKPLLPFGNQTVIESTIDYLRRPKRIHCWIWARVVASG